MLSTNSNCKRSRTKSCSTIPIQVSEIPKLLSTITSKNDIDVLSDIIQIISSSDEKDDIDD